MACSRRGGLQMHGGNAFELHPEERLGERPSQSRGCRSRGVKGMSLGPGLGGNV